MQRSDDVLPVLAQLSALLFLLLLLLFRTASVLTVLISMNPVVNE